MSTTQTLIILNNHDQTEVWLSVSQLSHAIHMPDTFIIELVEHELLCPKGQNQANWQFDAHALKRARQAASFHRDLDCDFSGLALALDLLDRIDDLESQLHRMEQLF